VYFFKSFASFALQNRPSICGHACRGARAMGVFDLVRAGGANYVSLAGPERFNKFSQDCLFTSGQEVESCCIIGLLHDCSTFFVLTHGKQNLLQPRSCRQVQVFLNRNKVARKQVGLR
jgi:hypothetical protein